MNSLPTDNASMNAVDVIAASEGPVQIQGSSRGGGASAVIGTVSWSKATQIGLSLTDQVLAVGGMFLANILLARVQSKEEYGMFALSYSVYAFITGLHNAWILEPYSVYGPGRYHHRFSLYSRVICRNNAFLGLALALVLLSGYFVLRPLSPGLSSGSLLGMAIAAPFLLTALFVRRTFYLRRRPDLAAKFSVVFFLCLIALLALDMRFGVLDGFAVFVIIAISWIVAGVFFAGELPGFTRPEEFYRTNPDHWSEHWKYARWVLATAFVCQLTTQGYYWLLAGFISVKDVAELRSMQVLVGPVDQICVALDLLVLPAMAFRHASKDHGKLVSLWKAFGVLNLVITGTYALGMRFVAKPLMHSVYGGKFDEVSSLLLSLAFLPVIMGIGNSFNIALKSIERPDLVFRAYFAGGAMTFALGIPVVRHFGLNGAVYGMLISAGTYTAVMGLGLVYSKGRRLDAIDHP